jgi:hypothetical protein
MPKRQQRLVSIQPKTYINVLVNLSVELLLELIHNRARLTKYSKDVVGRSTEVPYFNTKKL